MPRQLIIKIITILILGCLLIVPLNMVHNLIKERMMLRDDVVRQIAKSSAYDQTITGPLLVIPYQKTLYSTKDNKYYQRAGMLYFLPDTFNLKGDLKAERRKKGIYEARLYNSNNHITGTFIVPANFGITTNIADYQFEQPFIAMGISDVRGINNDLKLNFDHKTLTIAPSTKITNLGAGIHAKLDKELLLQGGQFDYTIELTLQGTSSYHISPIGRQTTVTLTSDWPHPSFDGNFLPISREINKQGFTAQWQTNFFASDIEDQLHTCLINGNCNKFANNSFGVSLVDPVDQYLKSDRAIKYSLLFIALTFAGFFLFEIIKCLAIHPIQYSFVGIALALFFLLLLSLSEHIGFTLAYLCSSTACIALIGFYVTGILPKKIQGLGFTALLIVIYAMLYVLLNGEDYSLLIGSLFVFGVLALAMIITRKLDWYKLTNLPNNHPKISCQTEKTNHD